MKTNMRLCACVLLVLFFLTACDRDGNIVPGKIRLVPLNTYDLAKAVTDEAGRMWLPASEIQTVLAKPVAADINFNEVKATKTLQYVLMNVGNTDVYDITFHAEEVVVYPPLIALIPAAGEGGDISMLPIVSFTREHVIPIDGVGSLMDMTVGAFSDILTLSYNYTLQDTSGAQDYDVEDEYSILGNNMGGLIDIYVSGKNVLDAIISPIEDYQTSWFMESVLFFSIWTYDLDTTIVVNSGNVPIPLQIINPLLNYYFPENGIILDTVIPAGGSVDISGVLRGDRYFENNGMDTTRGSIVLLGSGRNQPYIFTIFNTLCIDGDRLLWVYEHQ
ncbi:MAG: hypothetical protein K0B52_03755 [FCB group bacterium]|nr:hypothetical protein [FCB group bacterium]